MYILIFRLKSYQNFTLLKNSTLYHIQQADESRTVEQKVKHTYLSVYQELNNSVNDEELPPVCGIPHGVAELPTPIPKQVKQTVSQISSQQGTFVLHYTIPNIHISYTYICTCTTKPRNVCRGYILTYVHVQKSQEIHAEGYILGVLLMSSRTKRLKWRRMSCKSGRFLSLSLSRYWRAPSMYSTNVLFRQCSSLSITPESLKQPTTSKQICMYNYDLNNSLHSVHFNLLMYILRYPYA